MREIKNIIVHCSATAADMDIGVAQIRQWHLQKGWDDVGYHYVIRRNGQIETGRPEEIVGAHVQGYNSFSIGICLVGGVDADDKSKAEFNYTRAQMNALDTLLQAMEEKYPNASVRGHRDFPNVNKACPCFDVAAWWYGE